MNILVYICVQAYIDISVEPSCMSVLIIMLCDGVEVNYQCMMISGTYIGVGRGGGELRGNCSDRSNGGREAKVASAPTPPHP